MPRAVFCLIAALFIFQAAGLPAFVAEFECEERCPGDGAPGRCLPDCPTCACCGVSRLALTLTHRPLGAAPAADAVRAADLEAPPAPDPEEISHVPKSPLA